MKKYLIPIFLFMMLLIGCSNKVSTSPSINNSINSSTNSIEQENSSSSIINWESLDFGEIFEMNFKTNLSITFNDEDLPYETDISTTYFYNEGYIENALDHSYYLYESLISEEQEKREQKDINKLKLESSEKFKHIWLDSIYKLNYENDYYLKTMMEIDNNELEKDENTISLNLLKEADCDGYFFVFKMSYILKDIRGYMYYVGGLILF